MERKYWPEYGSMLNSPVLDGSPSVTSDNWEWLLAQDVWLNSFAFLSILDLAHCARTSKCWKWCAYDSSLWKHLDLSRYFYRMNDVSLISMLSRNRFKQLESLNLEGCTALTDASLDLVRERCPNLRDLVLTDCGRLSWAGVLPLVDVLPLRYLELYGTSMDMSIFPKLKRVKPGLDLGFAWLLYCSLRGVSPEGERHICRYTDNENQNRGCWGGLRGRLVFANVPLERAANGFLRERKGKYPSEVLLSCEAHTGEDEKDPDLHLCEGCEQLFRAPSMWHETACRTCFDELSLTDRSIWIPLTPKNLASFGFSDILSKTLRLADKRNLPRSLTSYGIVACSLSYQIHLPEGKSPLSREGEEDEEEGEEEGGRGIRGLEDDEGDRRERLLRPERGQQRGGERDNNNNRRGRRDRRRRDRDRGPREYKQEEAENIDIDNIKISVFLDQNRWRVEEQVNDVKRVLEAAMRRNEQRALLCFDDSDHVEVWADRMPLLCGSRGATEVTVTTDALFHSLSLIYSLILTLITVPYLWTLWENIRDTPHPEFVLSSSTLLIFSVALFVLLVAVFYLISRFRARCEIFCKYFLMVEIFVILAWGAASVLWIVGTYFPLEIFSCLLVCMNIASVGVVSIYFPVPAEIHRFFLLSLNALIAAMLLVAFGEWVLILILGLFLTFDLLSQFSIVRNTRVLQPLITSYNPQTSTETPPRIVFTYFDNVKLRASDLVQYGVLVGIGSVNIHPVMVVYVVVASIVMCCFVGPFVSKQISPFSVSCILILGLALIEPIPAMYLLQHNFLIATVTKVGN